MTTNPHYLVYQNMLLFIHKDRSLLHIKDCPNQSEAIKACRLKNLRILGIDNAPIARYID